MSSRRLSFPAKVCPRTGKLLGPDAERMALSLQEHYGGEFVQVTVEGISSRDANPRGYYFAGMIPHVAQAFKETGHNIDPESKEDRARIHEILKEYFITPEPGKEPSTKGFTAGHWRKYLRSIEEWLQENFNYKINDND